VRKAGEIAQAREGEGNDEFRARVKVEDASISR